MIEKTLRISAGDTEFIDVCHDLTPGSEGGYVISIHSFKTRDITMADVDLSRDAAKRLRIFLAGEETE